jgi:hypothetical protein
MIDLYKEIDWKEQLKENPELEEFLKNASTELSQSLEPEQLQRPVLDINLNLQIIGSALI